MAKTCFLTNFRGTALEAPSSKKRNPDEAEIKPVLCPSGLWHQQAERFDFSILTTAGLCRLPQ
jgi:hypothetical protein